jgi:glutamate 5-kinase
MFEPVQNLVVIKVGSSVLADGDSTRNLNQIYQIAGQICKLWEMDYKVVLITSGAVATGKTNRQLVDIDLDCKIEAIRQAKESSGASIDPKILAKQVWASIGQPELMADYMRSFRAHGRECSQALFNAEEIRNLDSGPGQYAQAVMRVLLENQVTPIINANDVLSPSELAERDFGAKKDQKVSSDNDDLAVIVCKLLRAKKLIIMTDVDGVFDGPPHKKGSFLVPEINQPISYYQAVDVNSGKGKGGMLSKLSAADQLIALGAVVHIVNGFKSNILLKVMKDEQVGTVCRKKL